MELVLFTICYVLSFAAASKGMYILSGCILTAAAALLGLYYFFKDGRRVCPPAVFSVSWVGGIGISCFKLSRLQTDWETTTWICFWFAFAAFVSGYKLIRGVIKDKCTAASAEDTANITLSASGPEHDGSEQAEKKETLCSEARNLCDQAKPILYMMNAVAAVSLLSLAAEACIIGYIPLFTKDMPHAYSYFHVSGLHYFTVSCVLLPALSCIYLKSAGRNGIAELKPIYKLDIFICMLLGMLIPILLVSRYQLLFGLMLAFFTVLIMNGSRISLKPDRRKLLAAVLSLAVLIMLYVFITIERAHSVEYLNSIFEMKYDRLPIFISQPYIYIANNFDNFNCLVRELDEFTHGMRMLFPVFALTGLKFIYPELAAFPIYVTKEELTTVTLIYDSYYDFGMIGVAVFCMLIGVVSAFLEYKVSETLSEKQENGGSGCSGFFAVLLYAQLCIYLTLSFFTTWFSNPTTWFYIGLTAAGYLISAFAADHSAGMSGRARKGAK